MLGDKLIIKEHHSKAAAGVLEILVERLGGGNDRHVATIAGESGSGKSEIAAVLAEKLEERGIPAALFQQDDYFVHPPKTNAARRVEDVGRVGVSEVRLELLDENLACFLRGDDEIEKPLVVFEEDRITTEKMSVKGARVAVVEGTYTTLLRSAGTRIFIDRTYLDTKKAREERSREKQDEVLEKILEIEHEIISAHKKMADILIDRFYSVKLCKQNLQTFTE